MESHGSVVLPIALGADDNFQTFLINFFIVNPMLPCEAILTWGEPSHDGAIVTVRRLDVSLGFNIPCARSF
jgi:hypothetical protein